MDGRLLKATGTMVLALAFVSGCASSAQKQRREQRERAIQTAKMYCEFINGEQYPDIDVALNLQMAQKCDADKSFSITNYKSPSEIPGVLFCCSVHSKVINAAARTERPVKPAEATTPSAPATTAPAAPATDGLDE